MSAEHLAGHLLGGLLLQKHLGVAVGAFQKGRVTVPGQLCHGLFACVVPCVVLPMSDSYENKLKKQLAVSCTCDISVVMLKKLKDEYADLLNVVRLDCTTFRDMKKLTESVNDMVKTDGEYLKILSAMEAEQISTFPSALDTAKHFDDYTRDTGELKEYGRSALERMGTPKNVIDRIEGYMDLEDFSRVITCESYRQ